MAIVLATEMKKEPVRFAWLRAVFDSRYKSEFVKTAQLLCMNDGKGTTPRPVIATTLKERGRVPYISHRIKIDCSDFDKEISVTERIGKYEHRDFCVEITQYQVVSTRKFFSDMQKAVDFINCTLVNNNQHEIPATPRARKRLYIGNRFAWQGHSHRVGPVLKVRRKHERKTGT